jgi:plasmid stabilization system protein ParE
MAYRVSLEAERDLEEVYLYGFRAWGEEKAFYFIETRYQRFQWLSENPEVTPIREDLTPQIYRSWVEPLTSSSTDVMAQISTF